MAVTSGSIIEVRTLEGKAGQSGSLQIAELVFTISGTYAQADNSILAGIAALINASRRNGKTVTLVDAMCGQTASRADASTFLGMKTVAIASADITFEITDNDFTTEYANATALPTLNRPFSLLVSFTEA